MRTSTGQPLTQGLFLHWRQRCASRMASSGVRPRLTSSKLPAALLGVLLGHGHALDLQALLGRQQLVAQLGLLELGHDPAAVLVELVVGGLAPGELVEVDQVAVELGAVDAGELGLAADGDAAAAAHAGAVDHDRVQRDDGLDAVLAREVGDGLHHGYGADGVDGLRPAAVLLVEDALAAAA